MSELDEHFSKVKGQFNLRVAIALDPLRQYGQSPFVDEAVNVIKMLNEIALFEITGEIPPQSLVDELNHYTNGKA